MAPVRPVLSLVLFGGLASAGLLNSRSIRARQLTPCLEDCLMAYDAETTCPNDQGQEVFNECWCADTSEPAQNLDECLLTCSTDEQEAYAAVFGDICSDFGGPSTTETPDTTATTTTSSSSPTGTGTEEEYCPDVCLVAYMDNSTCASDDTECFCTDTSSTADDLAECLSECTIAEQQDFESRRDDLCSSIEPSDTDTDTPSSTEDSSSTETEEPTTTETEEPSTTTDGTINSEDPLPTEDSTSTRTTTRRRPTQVPESTGAAGYMKGNLAAMAGGVLAVMVAL